MTAPPRAIASRVLEDPRVPWLLASIFAACGVVDVAMDRHLHDEGLLTHLFARMTWEQPVDLVFLQKSRPPIAVLYAPFAAAGPRAFAAAHVVVAALAVGLLASVLDADRHGPVHYIVQADQLHEIVALTNPVSGQRARVLAALGRGFYGTPAFADAFTPAQLPEDAVLILVDDPRLSLVMPPALWDPALRMHTASARFRIVEFATRAAPR